MELEVKVIPATRNAKTHKLLEDNRKKVAAYIRVSTLKGQQSNSFVNQAEYYRELIGKKKDWEFVGIYDDGGVTGTNLKKRDGFNKMIADALDGKIDLIVTKSITRFARNTMDTINNLRKLKAVGVEVYFENDNIWTLSEDGEFVITVISAMAQEESRSISENTKWGMRQNMKKGKGCIAFSRFLGYNRSPDGGYFIDEEEAAIVRRIYKEFLYGYAVADIVKRLEDDGIKTVTGKEKWETSVIKSILKNEKYCGDCVMQKYYVKDHMTKEILKNNGELPKYYVKNHHVPIVDRAIWELTQEELKRIKPFAKVTVSEGFFRGMVFCTACKNDSVCLYGPRIAHSSDKYRSIFYCCNNRYKLKCNAPRIKEDVLILVVVDSVMALISNGNMPEFILEKMRMSDLISFVEGKINYLTMIFVNKMIDKILVVYGDEVEVYFSTGKKVSMNLNRYETDDRLKTAYDFIKIIT